jgi:hypothetical protein
VRGVSEQHDVAVVPALVAHGREAPPDRAVREQRVALQVVGEERLAVRDRVLLGRRVEARALPRLLAALDDPGAEPLLERVRVDLEEAVLVLQEHERERLERQRGSEPAEAAVAPVEARAEVLREALADGAVDAVHAQDQVRVREPARVVDLGLEVDLHPESARAVLQDVQQLLARQPAEAVAGGAHAGAAVVGLDVVPVDEVALDLGVGLRIGLLQVAQGGVREDHAPAEGVV